MKFKAVGRAKVEVFSGKERVFVSEGKNLITNVGIASLTGLWNTASGEAFRYIALGQGTDPADATDTVLGDEVTFGGGERKLADTLDQTTTVIENDTARLIASFDITADFDLSEIGLFDEPVDGVLGAHRVFPGVSVTNGQTVVVTWTLSLVAL